MYIPGDFEMQALILNWPHPLINVFLCGFQLTERAATLTSIDMKNLEAGVMEANTSIHRFCQGNVLCITTCDNNNDIMWRKLCSYYEYMYMYCIIVYTC